jgi:hypothetical protein
MEHVIRQLRFRLVQRGRALECEGRSVEFPDGRVKLEIWPRTPEHPNQQLEVAPVKDLATAWRLFRKLMAHNGIDVREYREISPDGAYGEWGPLPE